MSFTITGIQFVGPNSPVAHLDFSPGLNVISGASDTGKSYVTDAIDFMFGGSTPLRPIEEARPYNRIYLGLANSNGEPLTIARGMDGGDFALYFHDLQEAVGAEADEALDQTHDSVKEDNISRLLLRLSDLDKKRVLWSADTNETRFLSFRYVSPLIVADEQRIITTESPARTGQHTDKTLGASVLRLFVTGRDHSGLVIRKKKEIRRAEIDTRIETYDLLISNLEADLAKYDDTTGIDTQIARLDASISEALAASRVGQGKLDDLLEKRAGDLHSIQADNASRDHIVELLTRFNLLDEHYRSDLERLEAMLETQRFFSALPQQRCPLCGALPQADPHGMPEDVDVVKLETACRAEVEKIRAYQRDLEKERTQLEGELSELDKRLRKLRVDYGRTSQTITDELEPIIRKSSQSVSSLLEKKAELMRAKVLAERLTDMTTRRELAMSEKKVRPKVQKETPGVLTSESASLCSVIEELLRSWGFPNPGPVTFSDLKQDIVIAGKDRGSFGKGLRAVSHASFLVGLLLNCRRQNMPHPGLVVLDSPLLTYRDPDAPPGEKVSATLKDRFYQQLAAASDHAQVIVFENEDPPDSVKQTVNYVHFSKSNAGRYGLFPRP